MPHNKIHIFIRTHKVLPSHPLFITHTYPALFQQQEHTLTAVTQGRAIVWIWVWQLNISLRLPFSDMQSVEGSVCVRVYTEVTIPEICRNRSYFLANPSTGFLSICSMCAFIFVTKRKRKHSESSVYVFRKGQSRGELEKDKTSLREFVMEENRALEQFRNKLRPVLILHHFVCHHFCLFRKWPMFIIVNSLACQ